MKQIALQSGISVSDFWDMTVGEVAETVEAINKKEEIKLKQQAIMDYTQAKTLISGIAALFSKDEEMLQIDQAYEWLFEKETKKIEEDKKNAQLEINKQRMKEYAEYVNKRRKEGDNGT